MRPVATERARARAGTKMLVWARDLTITAGVLVLFFTAYQWWGEPAQVRDEQQQRSSQLAQHWSHDDASGIHPPAVPTPPAVGAPFTVLSLPELGLRWTVVEGVTASALRGGPGHYAGTAQPGALGNFAVAGHRSRGIFLDLDQLAEGDLITVETERETLTYRLYRKEIVLPQQVSVIAPNPDSPGAAPTKSILTLTTCDPKWSNSHRLVIQAELSGIQEKM
jgi:sortase A